MRIPVSTDLSTRDGSVAKDARLVNSFVDGQDVYKRPAINSVLATATGQAQGGIMNVDNLLYVINGDIVKSYNSSFVLQATITL